MPLSATELHQRGVAAANARRFGQARRALTAASARTDDEDLRARIDGTVAYVLAQTGRPADAERLSTAALARPGMSEETVAVLSGQLGTLLLYSGRLDEAEAMLTRAIRVVAAESAEHANLLMNRAVVRMQRHELAPCVADLEHAAAIFEAAGEEEPLAEARHNLGYAALLGGDLVAALALMTRSRPALAATSDLAAAIGDLDRAEVLRDAGLTTEAEALLAEVAVQFGAQRMRQARGEAEFHLARSQLRHDPRAAERTARTAVRRFTALGSDGWATRAEAVRLDARLRAGGRTDPADFARTASALRRRGFRTEATGLALTARLGGRGRMPRLPPDAPTPLRMHAQEVRAVRASAAGRDREALRAASDGLELLTTWQQSFGALDLQASVAMHGADLMFAGLAAAARTGDPAVLFEWSERARHLSQQVAPVRPPHDPELAGDLAELRMLRADLAGTDWSGDARVRALRARVRERQWSTTGVGGTRTRIELAEAQGRIADDTAILAYVFTGAELQCVVVTASDARIVPLDWPGVRGALDGLRADLDVAALTRGGPMAALVERSLDERLRVLDDALLAPVRTAVQARRFALTIPGILAGIPWAMLPGLSGVPFTLATSVSRWLADRPTADRTRAPRAGFAAGPRVPRAEEEIRRAAAAWPSATLLTADDSRVTSVTDLAGESDVLHIAAHGRHATGNPMFSGLELADGTLFGYDVDLIPHVPATVLLSACELGRSSVRWGEEALGMTRVWLHAGTGCVIAAPVMVADAVAGELLSAVHEGLASGADAADALAAASLSTGLRAPFQCHGNGF
ncbi:CHAT domain-containing protein [Microbacterium sp. OVT16B]|uniref:CHAT domain-containing protein n=1 Tax=Microbacterium sp. OVT16B TaxID=2862682 RepID=UPI001CBC415C|nr:CHAT domain-containing protein [Microbacterium sp. OVT16B]